MYNGYVMCVNVIQGIECIWRGFLHIWCESKLETLKKKKKIKFYLYNKYASFHSKKECIGDFMQTSEHSGRHT